MRIFLTSFLLLAILGISCGKKTKYEEYFIREIPQDYLFLKAVKDNFSGEIITFIRLENQDIVEYKNFYIVDKNFDLWINNNNDSAYIMKIYKESPNYNQFLDTNVENFTLLVNLYSKYYKEKFPQ